MTPEKDWVVALVGLLDLLTRLDIKSAKGLRVSPRIIERLKGVLVATDYVRGRYDSED